MVNLMTHTAINVKNMEETLRFYKEALGFQKIFELADPETGDPFTAHTTNPVPIIVIDPAAPKKQLRSDGRLCDLAPTMLELMGLAKPAEMTGESLIVG